MKKFTIISFLIICSKAFSFFGPIPVASIGPNDILQTQATVKTQIESTTQTLNQIKELAVQYKEAKKTALNMKQFSSNKLKEITGLTNEDLESLAELYDSGKGVYAEGREFIEDFTKFKGNPSKVVKDIQKEITNNIRTEVQKEYAERQAAYRKRIEEQLKEAEGDAQIQNIQVGVQVKQVEAINNLTNTIKNIEANKVIEKKAKAEARWRQKEELNKIVRESAKEADEAHEKYMKEVWGDGIK